jgi:hypothetical protein
MLLFVLVLVAGANAGNSHASIDCTAIFGPRYASIDCPTPTARCYCNQVGPVWAKAICDCNDAPPPEVAPPSRQCRGNGYPCGSAGLLPGADAGCGTSCAKGYHGVCRDGLCQGNRYDFAICYCVPDPRAMFLSTNVATGEERIYLCELDSRPCIAADDCCSKCCLKIDSSASRFCASPDQCLALHAEANTRASKISWQPMNRVNEEGKEL